MFDFDLFVIGAGSGGVRASRMAAATGAKVAVAESRFLGGTCVNIGCVPKKLFYYGSHYSHDFKDSKGYGWDVDSNGISFDWPTLRDNKTNEVKRLNGIYQSLLDSAGVELIHGRATLLDMHTVEVDGKKFTANKILIATGCGPVTPDVLGKEFIISSDDVFYLQNLPETIVIVGGGYIAVEFAGIFHGLGVETHLIYRGTNILKVFDLALGEKLLEQMKNSGIHVHLETNVVSVAEQQGGQRLVEMDNGIKIIAGQLMYATGRDPLTRDLGLEDLGVELRPNGEIVVDEYFKSSVDSIYALGDIIGTPALTPIALAQGMAFVDTHFKKKPRVLDYANIATAVFSQPNIATVGLSEELAKQRYPKIAIFESEFKHLRHTLSGSDERTYMKLVVDETSDKVLGIHMLGAEAGEIIQGLAAAMKAGITKEQLDSTIGIHPTAAEEFVTMREKAR